MSKVIKMTLSTDSIQKAIDEVLKYKEEMNLKTMELVSRLADIGLEVIDANKYSSGDSDFNDIRSYVWLDSDGSTKSRATLVLNGKDIAFIEFGAGVHFNGSAGGSPNPFGVQLGYTIGSYGQGQGANDYWVYYDESLGRFKTSHGTEAAQPLAKADEEIRNKFISEARKVFKS